MSLSAYYLNSEISVVQLELLEISHPNFSQVFRIVRNATNGVAVILEDDKWAQFNYYPVRITPLSSGTDLEQRVKIDLGDLGEVLPTEIESVDSNNGFSTKPVLKYRTYRSDDLNNVLFGPITLEIQNLSFNADGVSFEAAAPSLNVLQTGLIYNNSRFPMLRGFV